MEADISNEIPSMFNVGISSISLLFGRCMDYFVALGPARPYTAANLC